MKKSWRRQALIFVLAAASLGASGQIFRTVDANGNVVFTDVPPADRPGAAASTEVTVPPVNTVPAVVPPSRANGGPGASSPGYYTQLVVVSPTDDEAVRENAGNVRIEVAVTPQLRPDHRLLLMLDGAPSNVAAVNGVFQLSNVDRGTRTVQVRVVDGSGKAIMESKPTTFHLMRAAVPQPVPIAPPRPPSAN